MNKVNPRGYPARQDWLWWAHTDEQRLHANSPQGITIGGSASGAGNDIKDNLGFGLMASGPSNGSLVQGNTVTGNQMGAVKVKAARGLRFV